MAASMRGLAQGLTRFQLPGAARLTLEERYARANADLDALERPDDDESFFAWATGPLVAKIDQVVHWGVATYTGLSFKLHTNFPRGYLVVFFIIGLAASGLYVYDIFTDFQVAFILLNANFNTEAGIVFMLTMAHFFTISIMLGFKFYYHFKMRVLKRIDQLVFPWDPASKISIQDQLQQQEVDAFLKTAPQISLSTDPYIQASSTPLGRLLLLISRCLRNFLQFLALVAYGLLLVAVAPLLDVAMMCLEVMSGLVEGRPSSRFTEAVLEFQNFLLQYQTIRVPAKCFLENLPQTAYQGYLWSKLRNDRSFDFSLNTLVTSIALSLANSVKNTIDVWIAYKVKNAFLCKVSGFSFWSYAYNALQFEGAATLPFRWNAKRSAMVDRLVLAGDFYTLAHAQKMKLFQAALEHRKSITITTDEAKALKEECVVVASSLTMLEFIASMLPVSLSDQHESHATIRIDINDIGRLPLRDDGRKVTRAQALKVLYDMHESLMEFINAPMIWQKLEVVRIVNCKMPSSASSDVDYAAVGELLIRSRVKTLEMTHTDIGDAGIKCIVYGLLENTSLVHLGLAGTKITAVGARQLCQGLSGHDTLAELDLSLNQLLSEGAQHLSRLIVTLPRLQQLHVAGIGMTADGLQALCMQASYAPSLRILNMSSNAAAFATPEAVDLLVTLLMRAPHGLQLDVGQCNLDTPRIESLCRGGMVGKRGLRGLGLRDNPVSKEVVATLCESLHARVQRDRYALGLDDPPPYVPYAPRAHASLPNVPLMRQHHDRQARSAMQIGGGLKAIQMAAHAWRRKPAQQQQLQQQQQAAAAKALEAGQLSIRHSHNPYQMPRPPSLNPRRLSQHFYLPKAALGDDPFAAAPRSSLSRELKGADLQGSGALKKTGSTPFRSAVLQSIKSLSLFTAVKLISGQLSSRQPSMAPLELSRTGRPAHSITQDKQPGWLTASLKRGSAKSAMWSHADTEEHDTHLEEEEEEEEEEQGKKTELKRTYLVLLELCHCGLRAEDADELFWVLAQAPGLRVLDLSHNFNLGNSTLGAYALFVMNSQHKVCMSSLRMACCGISAVGMRMPSVAYALSMLTELDLSLNPLGDEGVYELCLEVLEKVDVGLQLLRLSSVDMGMEGFNTLLDTLSVNQSLQRLDVSNNFIGAFDVSRFQNFQLSNKALKLLDLRHNEMSQAWAAELMGLTTVGMGRVVQL